MTAPVDFDGILRGLPGLLGPGWISCKDDIFGVSLWKCAQMYCSAGSAEELVMAFISKTKRLHGAVARYFAVPTSFRCDSVEELALKTGILCGM